MKANILLIDDEPGSRDGLGLLLRREGYVTGHFGKWHLGSIRADSPVNPGANGFDRWVSATNFYDFNPEMSDEGKVLKLQGEGSTLTMDLALDWIREKAAGEAPLFAVIWFAAPHFPHHATAEDIARTCHAHPGMGEAVKEAALAVHGRPIHM